MIFGTGSLSVRFSGQGAPAAIQALRMARWPAGICWPPGGMAIEVPGASSVVV
jgi:hypothetical protein